MCTIDAKIDDDDDLGTGRVLSRNQFIYEEMQSYEVRKLEAEMN